MPKSAPRSPDHDGKEDAAPALNWIEFPGLFVVPLAFILDRRSS